MEKVHQLCQIWKRAMCRRPAEQIYEAPAACEGLLPNHHPPVTPDDLISPQTETSKRSKTPEQWEPAARRPPPYGVLMFSLSF